MGGIPKIVSKWYIGLTILPLLGATTLGLNDLITGIILSWFIFFIFFLGAVSYKKSDTLSSSLTPKAERRNWAILYSTTSLSILGAIYCLEFYTGNSLSDVIRFTLSGESAYNKYQEFTTQKNLTDFTAAQIPAFTISILSKLWLIYITKILIADGERFNLKSSLLLALSCVPPMYSSLARGTSIELFELLFIFWLFHTIRSARLTSKKRNPTKSAIILTIALPIAFLFAFSYNTSSRYGFDTYLPCITNEICFDQDSTINYISPSLAALIYKLNGYFSFGLYFISRFSELFFESQSKFTLYEYILPLNNIGNQETRHNVCRVVLDCGANWVPDIIMYLDIIGIPLLLAATFFAGRIASSLFSQAVKSHSFIHAGACYFLILLAASLPAGNYIYSSYPNIASFLIIIALMVSTKYHQYLNEKNKTKHTHRHTAPKKHHQQTT